MTSWTIGVDSTSPFTSFFGASTLSTSFTELVYFYTTPTSNGLSITQTTSSNLNNSEVATRYSDPNNTSIGQSSTGITETFDTIFGTGGNETASGITFNQGYTWGQTSADDSGTTIYSGFSLLEGTTDVNSTSETTSTSSFATSTSASHLTRTTDSQSTTTTTDSIGTNPITYSYTSTSTSQFYWNFPSSFSVGTSTIVYYQTSTYSNLITTSSSSTTISTIITSTSSNRGSYFKKLLVVLPGTGEIIWYADPPIAGVSALSDMTSVTAQATIPFSGDDAVIFPTITPESTTSGITTLITGTSIGNITNVSMFTEATSTTATNTVTGGFTVEPITISRQLTILITAVSETDSTTSTFVSSTSESTDSLGTTTFTISVTSTNLFFGTFLDTRSIITSTTSVLPLSLNGIIYTTLAIPAFSLSSLESTISAEVGSNTCNLTSTFLTSSGSTGSDISSNIEIYGATSQNALLTTRLTNDFTGISLLEEQLLAVVEIPQVGFRIAPNANLVYEIRLGDTNSFSMFGADASFIYNMNETVPVAYPIAQVWIDSNNVTYNASWSSTIVSVTGRTPMGTSISTNSSILSWMAGDPVTDVAFTELGDSPIIRLGSGSYYTDIMMPRTVYLPAGAYSQSLGSNIVDRGSSFTLSSDDFVKTLAAVNPYFNGNAFLLEVRSFYNQ